jgi:DnaK suppressor protein
MKTDIYKLKLEEEKKLLEDELGSIGKLDKETGEWEAVPEEQTSPEADESDMADRTEDFGERSATTSALDARLDDINDALTKIEGGIYGMCESCGKQIEEDRLGANPAARTCKSCIDKMV